MVEHKKQHWIPKSYLAGWCDPNADPTHEPYVWVIPKEETSGRRKAPQNLFTEGDFYTVHLPDGSHDLTLEHGLAGLESEFCRIRDTVIAERKLLSQPDHELFCAFIAAMHGRTQAQRDHWKAQWGALHEKGEQLRRFMESLPPDERLARSTTSSRDEDSPTLSSEDVQKLAESPIQHMLTSFIRIETPMLLNMSLTFLRTEDELGFITSDAPCVWVDPEAYKRPFPFQQPFLASRTIEISMAVSPSVAAFLSWSTQVPADADVDGASADEMNRRTRFHANESIVVRQNSTRPAWYR